VVAIVFLAFSPTRMRAWQGRFFDVSTPAIQAGAAINDRISKLNKGLKSLDELEAENAALAAQNNELRASAQLLKDLADENRRLRDTLGYRERSAFDLVPAQIISRDASSWWSSAKINQGFAEKIDSAQPVLTADGLVGRTTPVAKDISMVMLLTSTGIHTCTKSTCGSQSPVTFAVAIVETVAIRQSTSTQFASSALSTRRTNQNG
jgi:rod shape-determining protein MreC